MASSDLQVVLDEWARPEFPELSSPVPFLPDREETIRRGFMRGLLSRDEARYLAGLAATA